MNKDKIYTAISVADNKKVTGELEERIEEGITSYWVGWWSGNKSMWQNHRVDGNTLEVEE